MGFHWPYRYRADYELREWGTLALRLREQPTALFWPVLGARRSGKTWALEALAAALAGDGEYIDLRGEQSIEDVEIPDAPILLLDEPGKHLFRRADPSEVRRHGQVPDAAAIERFLQWCRQCKKAGRIVTLALTPAEWVAVLDVGRERGFVDPARVEDDRLGPLNLLTHPKIQASPAASGLLGQLAESWRRNPYLLTQVLTFALETPGQHAEVPLSANRLAELQRSVIADLGTAGKDYLYYVLHEGLTHPQRQCLLAVAQGQPTIDKAHATLLIKVGLLAERPGPNPTPRYEIADPVLAAHLPPPVRIHHVSDLHFGAKSARRVDGKDHGPIGKKLAHAAGDGAVRDDYLDWLATLAPHARPHLLVVSGDIAEWGQADELAQGRAWLEQVAALLAEHAGLAGRPRVLLVPGNHDVDWNATKGTAGDRTRHLPFARAFAATDWPFPHLEDSPATRELAHVHYPEARLEFVLLGSSEYGGEGDPVLTELVEVLRKTAETHGNLDLDDKAQGVGRRYGRLDPGLVHAADIQRLRTHPWAEPVRIAVLHHPLSAMPAAATEISAYAGLVNAGRLKGALAECEFCLVLHGHAHTESIGFERWSSQTKGPGMLIASAATLGSRELQERHGFNEILVIREGPDYEVRVVAWERKAQTFVAGAGESIRVSEDDE